ncbi:SigE family RNA polymerase sigma factor [Micromonospora sicca]|uniref:SigE family RNA polymerase sigma factor n=1 Tax=Micromonospora sicca TaxID=2202420 RepID=A0A317DM12_9ACTN|nr:SigE family RNA polymerase sigma factor [Micromonospora sp. 4G51]PWR15638.1 SigE family RNA polymerase sigma factor [Micromonospora sp. 4G51]
MITPEGFDDFVVTRSPRLLRTAFLLTRDWALAEDLLQTALARAWEAWRRIDGDPEPYVRRIIVNAYASSWRRRWWGELPTADLPEAAAEADPHAGLDDRDRLWRALGRLPGRQRAVLVLRYFEDLSEVEISEVLGCSVGTVKSQASRAMAKLRLDETLTPEGMLG